MNTEMRRRLITPFVRGLFVCLLGSSGLAAAAVTEVEPNDSASSANAIVVSPGGTTISGMIGDGTDTANVDRDLFAFEATAGDNVSIETVGTLMPDGTGTCAGFSAVITLYDSDWNVMMEDAGDCESVREARISTALSTSGKYFVSIAEYPHFGDMGGVGQNMDPELDINKTTFGGSYELVITGANTPPPAQSVKKVPIKVRHWHREDRDLEKRGHRDPIVVAILSMGRSPTNEFEATTVDANSLTFGATGNEKSLYRCQKQGVDINGDRHPDIICFFNPEIANFHTGDRNGILKGKTKSGQQIEGRAALKLFTMRLEKRGFKHQARHDVRRNDKDNRKK
jgi:hypothetical protein